MVRIELGVRDLLLLLGLVVAALLAYLVRDVIVLLGIALMLTAALNPLVSLAARRGMTHGWAVAGVMLGLVLLPLVVLAVLSPLIIAEVQSLIKSIPTVQMHLDTLMRHLGVANRINDAVAKANPQEHIGGLAVVSVQMTASLLFQVLTVVVVTGYLLSDGPRLRLLLHEFVPRLSERHIEPLLQGMERVVGGYIRGQVITSVMFGSYAFVLCLALGVPSPLLLGIVAAVGDVIPLFGVPAAMLLAVAVAFTHSLWQPIAVLAGYLLYGQIESHIIMPRIYARVVNLSPLMVILATIAGGTLDGVLGVLIGIPIAGVLKVVFDYVVAERRRGHEEAAALMTSESTDPVGEENTKESLAPRPESTEALLDLGGIPPPTVSPFEPIPEPEPVADTGMELLNAASARIVRLEEQVEKLMEMVQTVRQEPEGSRSLRALP